MTLNEQQISLVEGVLIENLFSSNLSQNLLASDILCFMCRASSSPSFVSDLFESLFLLLNEIFVEDVIVKSGEVELEFVEYSSMQQVMLNLLRRISLYLENHDLNCLKTRLPFNQYSYLWKHLDCHEMSDMSPDEIHNMQLSPLDELFVKVTYLNDQQTISSLINSIQQHQNDFIVLSSFTLIQSIKSNLNFFDIEKLFQQMSKLMVKISASSTPSLFYRNKFVNLFVKTLNVLTHVEDRRFGNDKFIRLLWTILSQLFESDVLKTNFLIKQNFLMTLQNVISNPVFTNALTKLIYMDVTMARELKLQLRYFMVTLFFH